MNERWVAVELQTLDQYVNDALQILGSAERDEYDAGEAILYGRAIFKRFSSLLCLNFSQEPGSVRHQIAVSMILPQDKDRSGSLEDWKEKRDFELLPNVFYNFSGEKMVCVFESLRFASLRLIFMSGDRELVHYWQDFDPGWNRSPQSGWDFFRNQGDDWDEKLEPSLEIKRRSAYYQLGAALRLLQLIQRRGQVDETAQQIGSCFEVLRPLELFSVTPGA